MPGIGCSGRHGHAVGQQSLAENVAVDIVLDRTSDLKSVGTGQSLFRQRLVHPGRIQQEGDILQPGLLSGKIKYLPHIEVIVQSRLVRCRIMVLSLIAAFGRSSADEIVQKHFLISGDIDYRIVVILYHRPGTVIRGINRSVQALGSI